MLLRPVAHRRLVSRNIVRIRPHDAIDLHRPPVPVLAKAEHREPMALEIAVVASETIHKLHNRSLTGYKAIIRGRIVVKWIACKTNI